MDAMRTVPQRPISRLEIATYAVIPLFFIMAGVMPSSGIFIMPVLLPMLYLLFRRFGAIFPISCVCFYGLFSLVFNFDVLTVILSCFLLFALVGLIGACQTTPYLLCFCIAAVSALFGALIGAGIVRLAYDKPISTIASEYAIAEYDDPIVGIFDRYVYDNSEIPEDVGKKARGDAGYAEAAAEYTSEFVFGEIKDYGLYYAIHLSAVCAGVGFFVAVAVNRRTASARDFAANVNDIAKSTRAIGGVVRERVPISGMTLPRTFLWACVAPSLVASIVFDIIGNMDALSSCIMHAFVTIPGAFGFFALLAFFASLFKGRARVAAYVVLGLIGVAMVIFPMALFIGSMIGISDCILDLRYWTRYLMNT